MTDPPRPPILQPVSGTYPNSRNDVIAPTPTIPNVPSLTNGNSTGGGEDEEAFTIKCICQYSEDDGSTVLCESCNTWQHLDCYYEPENIPGEDDNHSCVDCEPRSLDARRANDIQRAKLGGIDTGDRKIKKPVKSHKKKVRPLDPSSAVWGDKYDLGSPRNGVPKEQQKKAKTGHKHSNSVHAGSTNAPKIPPRRSASHSAQSPSKSNEGLELTGEPYSEEFMHLYDHDPGESTMQANLFNNIAVTRDLATWSGDIEALAAVTNGKKHPDVFMRCESIDTLPRPQLHKLRKEDRTREFHGRHPQWVYLTSDTFLVRESFVGELRGKIGLMKDYVLEDANRWEYLRHPLPFVFFHPILPIYIDTRNEGSLVRYLRRSCQPNLALKSFIEGESSVKFGFVATREIEAGAELTIPWTTDEHVRAFTQQSYHGIKSEAYIETDENYILSYFSKVFADFGGCACEAPEDCAINKLGRRLRALTADGSSNGKKRNRKVKESTRTNASRSGSEAVRYKEDDEDDDAQSTSTDSRSKPQSRDMTPQDSKPPVMGFESEREKRKIAAALERMDQDKNQPAPKKKKRTSGPSISRPGVNPTDKDYKIRPVDTGFKNSASPVGRSGFTIPASARKSSSSAADSPTNSTAPRVRPVYVDSGMQTDPDPEELLSRRGDFTTSEPPRRKFLSLKKKLLMRSHSERIVFKSKSTSPVANGISNGTSSTIKSDEVDIVIPANDGDGDVTMENGPSISLSVSPANGSSPVAENAKPPGSSAVQKVESVSNPVLPLQPPPVPLYNSASASTSTSSPTTNGFRNADLSIPMPPNIISSDLLPTPTGMTQSPLPQSPSISGSPSYGSLVSPSPAKKKLSLGDYMMRRTSNLSKPEISLEPPPNQEKSKDFDIDVASTAGSVGDGQVHDDTETTEKLATQSSAVVAKEPDNTDVMDINSVPIAAADAMDVDNKD